MSPAIYNRPVMLDCEGLELTPEDIEILAHPNVGGVILFARNFESTSQVKTLCQHIHRIQSEPLLIAVDQEGGRVQRFKSGLTRVPPMSELGRMYVDEPEKAKRAAEQIAWLMASELRALDVDFSFAPVLDLNWGVSDVIGDRAFSADPNTVSALCASFQAGLDAAGMASVGKHFPGHGAVAADSHTDMPIDSRSLQAIKNDDLRPFQALIQTGLDAMMPAHVIYESVDPLPAGFSALWLQQVLRQQLAFDGVIFSDDLSMEGARVAGDHVQSALAAMEAGCDMVLVCNDRPAAERVVEQLPPNLGGPESAHRLRRMRARSECTDLSALCQQYDWQQARATCEQLWKTL